MGPLDPTKSEPLNLWKAPYHRYSPLPVSSDDGQVSLWATTSDLSSEESADSRPINEHEESADSRPINEHPSTQGHASDGTIGGYLASSQSDGEPLTSRYVPAAPVTPPLGQRNRPKTGKTVSSSTET